MQSCPILVRRLLGGCMIQRICVACCTITMMAACAHHRAPPATVATRTLHVVYADSATLDSLRRAHPPDPRYVAVARRYDSLAALVDTIVILSPESIVVHV